MSSSAAESGLFVLGPVSVGVDGRPVKLGGPLARRLLGVLLVNRGGEEFRGAWPSLSASTAGAMIRVPPTSL